MLEWSRMFVWSGLDQLTPELVVLENLTTLSGLECIGCMVVMCGADDLDKTA